MDTKKLLIGGAIAAVAAYFFIFKKKNAEAEAEAPTLREAQTNTNKKFAESISSNVEVVEVDKATEEHNNAINEYKKLSGGYAPPSGLSTKQIEKLIDDMNQKNDALAQYVTIAGEDDIKDEDMTLAQVQNEIVRATNEKVNPVIAAIDAIDNPVTLNSITKVQTARAMYNQIEKNEDLKKKILNYSKLQAAEATIAQLQALQAKEQAWNARKAAIEPMVKAFKKTATDIGTVFKMKSWDRNCLIGLTNLPYNEKVYANWYFYHGLGGAKVCDAWKTEKTRDYYQVNYIYRAIPNTRITTDRDGQARALACREAYLKINSQACDKYGNVI